LGEGEEKDKKEFRGEEVGVPLQVIKQGETEPRSYPRYILELDKERVYIKTDQTFPAGTRLTFIFEHRQLPRKIELFGEVVRINLSSTKPGSLDPGMGIVFDQINLSDRNLLNRFFEDKEKEDRTAEYLRFLGWMKRMSKPLPSEEKEKIKRDLLQALYGEERKAMSTSKKKREDLEILSHIPLFQELDILELGEIAELLMKERFEHGQLIFNEGDAGDKLYVILRGEVEIFKKVGPAREEILATLKSGDYFGEMSLVDLAPRSATARAKGELSVLTMTKKDFDLLLKASDLMAAKIYKFFVLTISKRLRDADDKIKKIVQVVSGPGAG